MRGGWATCLYHAGVGLEYIRLFGMWKSSTFAIYLHFFDKITMGLSSCLMRSGGLTSQLKVCTECNLRAVFEKGVGDLAMLMPHGPNWKVFAGDPAASGEEEIAGSSGCWGRQFMVVDRCRRDKGVRNYNWIEGECRADGWDDRNPWKSCDSTVADRRWGQDCCGQSGRYGSQASVDTPERWNDASDGTVATGSTHPATLKRKREKEELAGLDRRMIVMVRKESARERRRGRRWR